MNRLAEKAIKSPKIYIWTTAIITIVIIILVALPMLTEKFANILHPLTIDTDPESMLAYDAPVRVTHRAKKKEFGVFDLMAIGVVNKTHKNGVFNKKTLNKVYDLATYAKSLQWKDKNNKTEGVLGVELISPSNVDNIEQGGPGTVKFNWLMPKPPTTEAEALEVFRKIQKQPILKGSLSSSDGQALALYIPLSSKHVSYKISALLKKRIASYDDEDEFFITGLAVAQDTFAIEMFQQMAITTPLAMILIFGSLWFFFRNITLVISPMIIAIVSAIVTMGLLIVTGNAIHILSSMIPIFIMPIAVLDAIHILSDFYDRYPQFKDRKKAIQFVMSELAEPMLLTSVTTAIGFGALALIPLPPM